MPDASLIEASFQGLAPEQLQQMITGVLPAGAGHEEKVAAIEAALKSPMGQAMRAEMAKWIVENLVPAERLVPQPYAAWRQPVHDAMTFVVTHLSEARLAPKLLEQLELPPDTRPEARLLRLIAKVPGLQKIGQVLARNRHLRSSLRRALTELENGIRDVDAPTVAAIVRRQLGPALQRFDVVMDQKLLSEASVSAVLGFAWRNPESGERERGVFKVLKPHVPACFTEDMDLLDRLAHFFGRRRKQYGPGARLIPDTFRKVRRLLQHEVNFLREQKTLLEAGALYRRVSGVRVPRLIRPLCTRTITAISEEAGTKVTDAAARMPEGRRVEVAGQLVEALLAIPLFASSEQSLFHADPHAGNLLYDSRRRELVILDWALRERLSRDQRRHLALLFLMVALRDPVGASNAVGALAETRIRRGSRRELIVRERVRAALDQVPLTRLPSAVDAMRLLEQVAYRGVRFPGPLIMLSKVLFTLDGILEDIGGSSDSMGMAMARHIARRWLTDRTAFASPLRASDWITLQCSALLYSGRMWLKGEQALVDRFLKAGPGNGRRPAKAAPQEPRTPRRAGLRRT